MLNSNKMIETNDGYGNSETIEHRPTLHEKVFPVKEQLDELGYLVNEAMSFYSALRNDPKANGNMRTRALATLDRSINRYTEKANAVAELMVNMYALAGPTLNKVAQERLHVIHDLQHTIEDDKRYKHGELISMTMFMLTGDRQHIPANWSLQEAAKMDAKEWPDRILIAIQLLMAELDRTTAPEEVAKPVKYFLDWLGIPVEPDAQVYPLELPESFLSVEDGLHLLHARVPVELFNKLCNSGPNKCELHVTQLPTKPSNIPADHKLSKDIAWIISSDNVGYSVEERAEQAVRRFMTGLMPSDEKRM